MGIVRFRIVATHNRLPALAVADNALTGKSEPQVNMCAFVRCPRWSLIGLTLGETHLFVGPSFSTCFGARFGFVLFLFSVLVFHWSRWSLALRNRTMPPRRSARKNTPMLVGSPFESVESRLKRLRPNDPQDPPLVPVTRGTTVPRVPPPPKASATIPGRADAPAVRHLRRGDAGNAAAAVASVGMAALVAALISDRVASSSRGPSSSL